MRTSRALFTAIAVLTGVVARLTAQVEMEPVDDPALLQFYKTVATHFAVTPKEVQLLHRQQIRDEQVAVVFLIAQKAGVAPKVVAERRLSGADFIAIASRYKLGADVFHFPASVVAGKPYEQAYSAFEHTPRERWHKILLTDEAIINLVNLRVLVDQNHCRPDEVMTLRAAGRNFIEINQQLAASKSHG